MINKEFHFSYLLTKIRKPKSEGLYLGPRSNKQVFAFISHFTKEETPLRKLVQLQKVFFHPIPKPSQR